MELDLVMLVSSLAKTQAWLPSLSVIRDFPLHVALACAEETERRISAAESLAMVWTRVLSVDVIFSLFSYH